MGLKAVDYSILSLPALHLGSSQNANLIHNPFEAERTQVLAIVVLLETVMDWPSGIQGICPVSRSVLGPFGAF